jgi:hypothetical protein
MSGQRYDKKWILPPLWDNMYTQNGVVIYSDKRTKRGSKREDFLYLPII